jgi:hypothetical protein
MVVAPFLCGMTRANGIVDTCQPARFFTSSGLIPGGGHGDAYLAVVGFRVGYLADDKCRARSWSSCSASWCVSRPSCGTLSTLARAPPTISIGGTSKLGDRVEAADLCCRRPNPDDWRSSAIELTSAGRRLLTAANRTFAAELDSLIGTAVSARSLQQFTATVGRLRRGLLEVQSEESA